ncbi:GTP-binding protein [Microbulbifer flavimaris]|uniref:GTP-binding protein n=1 Tax=Microbulbifer flavimaris TaxID=1781068 RepID=A0ABX4I5R3_9GAMM|nr:MULTISPECIES: GTP-binding protein [Microbulbifer]PCO06874.1 GTP-binding protein [Microbulbifer flavimaris]
MQKREEIRAVPVNVITGFLGVGKTTAIRHLLESKPRDERWAVLVNEFGEIGIDGGLFGSQQDGGLFVREVPGGCMCCTAGLPMQIALNQLLVKARPHRLLIEPTGLGHPREVLETLAESVQSGVLDLHATLTLVDARKISDERYLSSDTFRQQLEVADLVVANKSDLYGPDDLENLRRYLSFLPGGAEKPLQSVVRGRVDPDWLGASSAFLPPPRSAGHRHPPPVVEDEPLPECGYLRSESSGEGYHSCGWRFSPVFVFDYKQLLALITGSAVERLKGIFITDEGVFGFNKADSVLSVLELDDALESRVEVIDPERRDWAGLEADWLGLLTRG